MQYVVSRYTLEGKGDPHGGAGRCSPLLQLPLLEGVMGLSTTLKWSGVVGVVYMMLLPGMHLIRLVRILVGGCPCTYRQHHNTRLQHHLQVVLESTPKNP